VDLPDIKPNYFLKMIVNFFLMILDHSLSKFHDMTHKFNFSVINITLYISFIFEN
jgi:hypothetical protein